MKGRVWKSNKSKYWLIEVPSLDLMTQGSNQGEALTMICEAAKELAKELIDNPDFKVGIRMRSDQEVAEGTFEIWANDKEGLKVLAEKRCGEAP